MIAIRVRNLNKYFHGPRGVESFKPADARQVLLSIIGFKSKLVNKNNMVRTVAAEHALRDVSLDIEKGATVCLVGHSGSGKSVFLKILAGVIPPCTGRVEIAGAVSSLLNIRDNLNLRLTAIENIVNFQRAARTPGVSMKHFIQKVISFAELNGFERLPVRQYSTGMIMRLSIALVLQSDFQIVLIDDVLGVGDIAFQQKVVTRLHELKKLGCTLILACDDENLLQQLATHVINFNNGVVRSHPVEGFFLSKKMNNSNSDVEWHVAKNLPENEHIALRSISFDDSSTKEKGYIKLSMEFEAKVGPLRHCRPVIDVKKKKVVLFRNLYPENFNIEQPGYVLLTVEIPIFMLKEGDYKLTAIMVTEYRSVIHTLKALGAVTFQIKQNTTVVTASSSLMTVPLFWEFNSLKSERIEVLAGDIDV